MPRKNALLAGLLGLLILGAACSMVKPQYPPVPAQAKLVEFQVPSCT